MTDESRASKPQPPNDRSADVKSVANISAIGDIILSAIFLVTLVVSAVAVAVSDVAVAVNLGNSVDGGFVAVNLGHGVGFVVAVGGGFVVRAVVNSVAFTTFIGNAVRGVSQLRLALRQTGAAAPFAVAVWIGGRNRRWQAEDWQAALAESPRPIRYSLGLVAAAVRMRLYDLGGLLLKVVRWVLATEVRTWTPLTGLLLWGGAETTLDTGLGAAILTVIGASAVFHTGVTLGRKQLGVEVRRREKTEQPDSPAGP